MASRQMSSNNLSSTVIFICLILVPRRANLWLSIWPPDFIIAGCPAPTALHSQMSEESVLVEAPVFHPTEAEFRDPLVYIGSIRKQAQPFGICRIVPPKAATCAIRTVMLMDRSRGSRGSS